MRINPSDTVTLGRTGLRVTRLGLGMRPLGLLPVGQEATGQAIVHAAVRLGIRLLDTAPTYGNGEAERRLGEVSADLPSSLVVSTKVGKVLGIGTPRRPVRVIAAETIAGGPAAAVRLSLKAARLVREATVRGPRASANPPVAQVDYSYDGTMRSIEGSLSRIGSDRVDIVFIHDPDDHAEVAMAGAYRALDRLRADGTITAVGIGTNHWQPLLRMAQEGDFDCFLLAGRYSLLDQSALEELLPMAQARGIPIIIGGVFNGGIVADPRHAFFDYAPASRERMAQARHLYEVCDRHGVDVKAAALQFPFGHPAVTSVLVGVASVAELEEDERLARTLVPTALWEELRHEGLLAEAAPLPTGADPRRGTRPHGSGCRWPETGRTALTPR
jgi:D-threo-aldose 1-dehydrogenase